MSQKENASQSSSISTSNSDVNSSPPTPSKAADMRRAPASTDALAVVQARWSQWAQQRFGAQSPTARVAFQAAMNALKAGQDEKAAAQAGALAVLQARWAQWAQQKFGVQSPAARFAFQAAMNALRAGRDEKAAAQAGALAVLQARWAQWVQQKFGVKSPAARVAFQAAMNALKSGQDHQAAARAAELAVKGLDNRLRQTQQSNEVFAGFVPQGVRPEEPASCSYDEKSNLCDSKHSTMELEAVFPPNHSVSDVAKKKSCDANEPVVAATSGSKPVFHPLLKYVSPLELLEAIGLPGLAKRHWENPLRKNMSLVVVGVLFFASGETLMFAMAKLASGVPQDYGMSMHVLSNQQSLWLQDATGRITAAAGVALLLLLGSVCAFRSLAIILSMFFFTAWIATLILIIFARDERLINFIVAGPLLSSVCFIWWFFTHASKPMEPDSLPPIHESPL